MVPAVRSWYQSARVVGCPALDSEPHKPPPTHSEAGAVKVPHAHIHGAPQGHRRRRGGTSPDPPYLPPPLDPPLPSSPSNV